MFSGRVPLAAAVVERQATTDPLDQLTTLADPGAVITSLLDVLGEGWPLHVMEMSHHVQVAGGVVTVGWAWAAAASARPRMSAALPSSVLIGPPPPGYPRGTRSRACALPPWWSRR